MQNYFEFFNLPRSFNLDEAKLKQKFLQNSRAFHPDFFIDADEEEMEKAQETTATNNQAYKTLSDFYLRWKYILELEGIVLNEAKNELSPDFLMEMMEINEAIEEMHEQNDETSKAKLLKEMEAMEATLIEETKQKMMLWDCKKDEAILQNLKESYLKYRYILRIKENINRFASL